MLVEVAATGRRLRQLAEVFRSDAPLPNLRHDQTVSITTSRLFLCYAGNHHAGFSGTALQFPLSQFPSMDVDAKEEATSVSAQVPDPPTIPEEERRIMKKIDCIILPMVFHTIFEHSSI